MQYLPLSPDFSYSPPIPAFVKTSVSLHPQCFPTISKIFRQTCSTITSSTTQFRVHAPLAVILSVKLLASRYYECGPTRSAWFQFF